ILDEFQLDRVPVFRQHGQADTHVLEAQDVRGEVVVQLASADHAQPADVSIERGHRVQVSDDEAHVVDTRNHSLLASLRRRPRYRWLATWRTRRVRCPTLVWPSRFLSEWSAQPGPPLLV